MTIIYSLVFRKRWPHNDRTIIMGGNVRVDEGKNLGDVALALIARHQPPRARFEYVVLANIQGVTLYERRA